MAARGGRIPSRTQSSVAVTGDGRHWFLINASPDIRSQFEAFAPLHPASTSGRNSPLEGVLITNADLDHTAGLLLLREGESLHLHASEAVRRHLSDPLAFTPLLTAFCGITWYRLPVDLWAPLPLRNGLASGLAYQALPLRSPPPVFRSGRASDDEETMAFLIRDEKSGGVLLVAPDVFELSPSLHSALQKADAVLFDGTFWTEKELGTVKAKARHSSAMGHLTIRNGSLEILSKCAARQRIYLHINNTNPILMPGSPERQEVEDAGIVVGWDGLEFEL